MSPFDQHDADCRCEWGVPGLDSLAPAAVVIVVDVRVSANDGLNGKLVAAE